MAQNKFFYDAKFLREEALEVTAASFCPIDLGEYGGDDGNTVYEIAADADVVHDNMNVLRERSRQEGLHKKALDLRQWMNRMFSPKEHKHSESRGKNIVEEPNRLKDGIRKAFDVRSFYRN